MRKCILLKKQRQQQFFLLFFAANTNNENKVRVVCIWRCLLLIIYWGVKFGEFSYTLCGMKFSKCAFNFSRIYPTAGLPLCSLGKFKTNLVFLLRSWIVTVTGDGKLFYFLWREFVRLNSKLLITLSLHINACIQQLFAIRKY